MRLLKIISENALWLYLGLMLAAAGYNPNTMFFWINTISIVALVNLRDFARR